MLVSVSWSIPRPVMQEGKVAGSRLSRLGGRENVMVSKCADKGRAWSMVREFGGPLERA